MVVLIVGNFASIFLPNNTGKQYHKQLECIFSAV